MRPASIYNIYSDKFQRSLGRDYNKILVKTTLSYSLEFLVKLDVLEMPLFHLSYTLIFNHLKYLINIVQFKKD
jgi:hypothetical protein